MTAFTEEWYEQNQAKRRAERARVAAVPSIREADTSCHRPCKGKAAAVSELDAAGTAGGAHAPATNSKPKRRQPEQALHIAAVKFLTIALPPTWRVVHVANGVAGGDHSALVANQFRKAMGVRAGFPDLEMIGPGRFVVAEAKADKGRLSPEQAEWRDWFQSIGVPWFVFRSHDELVAGCLDAGVPLRVRAS